MINKENTPNIPQILSEKARELYRKFKAFVMKIYSIIKFRNNEELKQEFSQSYLNFASRLKQEGLDKECNDYMNICVMYEHLMDRPDELIAHKDFFNNLYGSFENLLTTRINNPDEYEKKYEEFKISFGESRSYFYTQVARPSPHYDEEVLGKIQCGLFKVIE